MAKKTNSTHSYVLTANGLSSGDVVFWSGSSWDTSILAATFASGDSAIAELENVAVLQEAENSVVGAYLVPMQSAFQPVAMRERQRLAGPSIAYLTTETEPQNLAA